MVTCAHSNIHKYMHTYIGAKLYAWIPTNIATYIHTCILGMDYIIKLVYLLTFRLLSMYIMKCLNSTKYKTDPAEKTSSSYDIVNLYLQ